MLIAITTGTGLQQKIRSKVIGFDGHIQITSFNSNYSHESTPITINDSVISEITELKNVKNTQVFATKAGILKTKENFEGVMLKGVSNDYNWWFFNQYIIKGDSLAISKNEKNKGLIISKQIANQLNVKLNDKVYLYFVRENVNTSRTLPFYIKGIYHTGLEDFDNTYVFGDIKHIQQLNHWDVNQIGGLEINLHNAELMEKTNAKINKIISYDLLSETAKNKNKQMYDWLALFDTNIFVILIIMILVAIVNMTSCMLILILEKTQMIGILKAIGISNWSIRKIFLLNAGYLIVKGLIWGNLIGLGICIIQYYTEIFKLNETTYYVSSIPIHFNFTHIVALNLITIIVCCFMMIFPSYIITKISPIKAIRFQ